MEHIRPPIDRPPKARRCGPTPSREANSLEASRIVWMHTAGGSGRRLPAAWLGNSMRSTTIPEAVTTSSTANNPGWSRRALLPGVRMRPAGLPRVMGHHCSWLGLGTRQALRVLVDQGPGNTAGKASPNARSPVTRGACRNGRPSNRARRSREVASSTTLDGECRSVGTDATTPCVTLTR
jgi:hypothetical protein